MKKAVISLVLFGVFSIGCRDKIPLNKTEELLPENSYHWSTIYETQEGELYVGGGLTWTEGVIAKKSGDSWQIEHSTESGQVLTFAEAKGNLYASGMIGYRHAKINDEWETADPIYWKTIYDLIPIDSTLLGFGGDSDGNCNIFSIKGRTLDNWQLMIDTLPFRPTATAHSENQIATGGFGYVYISDDNGLNWRNDSPAQGFYKDIQYVGERLYVMNDKGKVFTREKESNEWKQLRNPNHGKRYNGFYFFDRSIGYIVGDEGLIEYTSDGGDNWDSYQLEKRQVINDIYRLDNDLYIAGNEGLLVRIDAF